MATLDTAGERQICFSAILLYYSAVKAILFCALKKLVSSFQIFLADFWRQLHITPIPVIGNQKNPISGKVEMN
jgi:hypothetical protein